jgi:transposase
MTSDKEAKGTHMEWQTMVPYDTRQLAIKEAVEAFNSAIALKKKGYIQNFSLRYKSRKMPKKIFWIDKRALSGAWNLFPQRLGKHGKLRFRKSMRSKLPTRLPLESNSKILYDHGAYYLVMTLKKQEKQRKTEATGLIALDPGVRSFMTGYSPDQGNVCKIGERQIDMLKKLHQRIDLLRSVRSKAQKKRTRQNLRKRLLKLEKRGIDLINDLHNQTASWLSKTYSQILLPTFGTSKMLSGNDLPKGVNRRMQGLAFYRFKEKLEGLCKSEGTQLFLVGEEYTTKTCGCCGEINSGVGSSKTFKCSGCGLESDRDFHAARNIVIKTMTQHGDDAHRLNFWKM